MFGFSSPCRRERTTVVKVTMMAWILSLLVHLFVQAGGCSDDVDPSSVPVEFSTNSTWASTEARQPHWCTICHEHSHHNTLWKECLWWKNIFYIECVCLGVTKFGIFGVFLWHLVQIVQDANSQSSVGVICLVFFLFSTNCLPLNYDTNLTKMRWVGGGIVCTGILKWGEGMKWGVCLSTTLREKWLSQHLVHTQKDNDNGSSSRNTVLVLWSKRVWKNNPNTTVLLEYWIFTIT